METENYLKKNTLQKNNPKDICITTFETTSRPQLRSKSTSPPRRIIAKKTFALQALIHRRNYILTPIATIKNRKSVLLRSPRCQLRSSSKKVLRHLHVKYCTHALQQDTFIKAANELASRDKTLFKYSVDVNRWLFRPRSKKK